MSHHQRRKLRLQTWALAGLLLAVSCGRDAPSAPLAPTAPPVPVAWPTNNPFPEQSARRIARLAELRDPANDEVASLALRYLEDVTSTGHRGSRLQSVSAAAFLAGDVDTAVALVEAILPASGGWHIPYSRMAGQARSGRELDALLALLHDLPPAARGAEAAYALGGLVDSMAVAGRLPELEPFALAITGGRAASYLLSSMAEAYLRQGEMEKARLFAVRDAGEYATLAMDEPSYLLDSESPGVASVRLLFRLGLEEEGGKMLALARELLIQNEGKPDILFYDWARWDLARPRAFGVLLELYAMAGKEEEWRGLWPLAAGCLQGWDGLICRLSLPFRGVDSPLAQELLLARSRGRAARGDVQGAAAPLRLLVGERRRQGSLALALAQMRAGGDAAQEGLPAALALAREIDAPREPGLLDWRGLELTVWDVISGVLDAGDTEAALRVVAVLDKEGARRQFADFAVSRILDGGERDSYLPALAGMEGAMLEGAVSAVAAAMRSHPSGWEPESIEAVGLLAWDLPAGKDRTSALLNTAIALARTGQVDEARRHVAEIRATGDDGPTGNRYWLVGYTVLLALVGEEDEAMGLLLAHEEPESADRWEPEDQFFWLAAALLRAGLAPTQEARGRLRASASAPQPRCGSWERASPRVEALRLCLVGRLQNYSHEVKTAFISDDLLAVATLEEGVDLWNIAGDSFLVRSFPAPGEIGALAVHPQTGRLAVGNRDGLLAIGDLASGEWVLVEQLGSQVQELRFAADGSLAVVHEGGRMSLVRPGGLAMEPLMSGLSNWETGRSAVALSPDGATVFSARSDGWLQAVDLEADPPRRTRSVQGAGFRELAVFPSGDLLLLAEDEQGLVLRDADTLLELRRFDTGGEAQGLRVSPVGQMFATVVDGELQLWRLDGEEPYFSGPLTPGELYWRFSISPDGQTLFATGRSGSAVFLAQSGETLAGPLPGRVSRTTEGSWSPDSRSVAASEVYGGLIVWRLVDPPAQKAPTN